MEFSETDNVKQKQYYEKEIVNPTTNVTYNAQIGLYYVSDLGYALLPENWNTAFFKQSDDNIWLFIGTNSWTITPNSGNETHAFPVTYQVNYTIYGNVAEERGVRSTFYLTPNVAYVSGDGSINLPFRIK